jgi:hypothetical protein
MGLASHSLRRLDPSRLLRSPLAVQPPRLGPLILGGESSAGLDICKTPQHQ